MTSDLSPANQLLDAARGLAPAIEEASAEIDRERRLPEDIVMALKTAGLFKILIPRTHGGSEASLLELSQVIEEVAKADASTGWCLGQNAGITRWSGYLSPEGAAEVFGSEDFSIAWGQGRARAIKVDGGYRLTGEWAFVSGVRHARWLGCQDCPVTDEQGEPVRDDAGSPQRRVFFFPAADAEVIDVWQVAGLRGTGSDTFRVTDIFVPERRSPGQEPVELGPTYVFNTTNLFSVGFASAALGVGRGALEAFLTMAVTKSPRGISGALREQQNVQIHVAECEAHLRSARAYLHEVIDIAWGEAVRTRELTQETRIQLRLSSTYAFRRAAEVVNQLYYLAGTSAIPYGGPIERRLRDMNAITQHIQGREDHFEPAGQFLMGIEPSPAWL